jgi:hypothetical protein
LVLDTAQLPVGATGGLPASAVPWARMIDIPVPQSPC